MCQAPACNVSTIYISILETGRNLPKILKDRYTKEDNQDNPLRSIGMAMQKQYARELMRFIDQSPSVYHVIKNAAVKLEDAGFTRLKLSDVIQLKPAG